jgi:hypothetical protein
MSVDPYVQVQDMPMAHLDITLTIGNIEIGILMATLLYGILVVQVYLYAGSRQTDQTWLKLAVAVVLCVAFLLLANILVCLYQLIGGTVHYHHFGQYHHFGHLLSDAP